MRNKRRKKFLNDFLISQLSSIEINAQIPFQSDEKIKFNYYAFLILSFHSIKFSIDHENF